MFCTFFIFYDIYTLKNCFWSGKKCILSDFFKKRPKQSLCSKALKIYVSLSSTLKKWLTVTKWIITIP